jgi:2-polyprenyl-6-methoxyphenol hydroxylase-like FAD-dependent oxidoreductase
MAAVYAVGDHPSAVHAILCVKRPVPTREEISDLDHQRDLMRTEFSGAGWEIPRMLKDLTDAADDDVFCDTLSQIQMPTWSTGRVALAGDAGYAASFLSGQGTSLAVVGAYILAGELAADSDHRAAFAQYEDRMRGFVTQNQELAIGSTSVLASTNRELWLRNQMFRLLPLLTRLRITNTLGGKVKRAAAAIDIPAYGPGTSGSGI